MVPVGHRAVEADRPGDLFDRRVAVRHLLLGPACNGATWQPSHVVRLGHHGLALLWHPTTAGFVSLRTSARDAAGNTVTQTVLRAYQIR